MLKENSTGLIHLEKKENSEELFFGGKITITPVIGHTEGQFKSGYHILPKKGVTAEYVAGEQFHSKLNQQSRKTDFLYKSLSDIESTSGSLPVINFYNEKEFRLLLNNQIAYFKSTSKIFTLCSIILDEAAAGSGLISLNQLKQAVRLTVNKKDKITVIDKRIIILVVDEDQKSVNTLIAGIKNNLPLENAEQLIRIIKYISVYTLQVDDTIYNADDMLKKMFPDKFRKRQIN
jgi:circadian clock protein KaiC